MSATTVHAPAPSAAMTLRTLAGIEARRYATHPLFLLGVAVLVLTSARSAQDLALTVTQGAIGPAFLLGLLGVFVGYQLTRSMGPSTDAIRAAPADGALRTAALCLACLVPGAVALVWVAWLYLGSTIWPPTDSPLASGPRLAMLLAAVPYAVGGPLVGVLVGRWTRFPGAGLVAVVLLFVWTWLGTVGLAMSASHLGTLIRLNAPYGLWISADGPQAPQWVAGGSPWWYLAYICLLCGMAASAAILHDAVGRRRSRVLRLLVVLTALALVCLALATAADPTRLFL